ncbi:uncharacterized protein KY384_000333 [Bacidia gigantensis]|uniref:uncharacterized protein n=1 Tax=Bacidia gigantensis TaxID=2732470 RepID=UPI001D0367BE|nr:uncharacterized protein KY384_000333 [Bacidia gigantensis]KAG8526340.1 hypothetical protein KY384_000333 [Bacidia gigantensis]
MSMQVTTPLLPSADVRESRHVTKPEAEDTSDKSQYRVLQHSSTQQTVPLVATNITLLRTTTGEIDAFKAELDKRFTMKHLGPVKTYLGVSIIRDPDLRTIYAHQAGYLGSRDFKVSIYIGRVSRSTRSDGRWTPELVVIYKEIKHFEVVIHFNQVRMSGVKVLAALTYDICKVNHRKLLIFVDWPTVQWVVEFFLTLLGFKCLCVRASMTAIEREQAIDAFRDPTHEGQVLVTSFRISATAINLQTACCDVCFVEIPPNWQTGLQTGCRVARLGQLLASFIWIAFPTISFSTAVAKRLVAQQRDFLARVTKN